MWRQSGGYAILLDDKTKYEVSSQKMRKDADRLNAENTLNLSDQSDSALLNNALHSLKTLLEFCKAKINSTSFFAT